MWRLKRKINRSLIGGNDIERTGHILKKNEKRKKIELIKAQDFSKKLEFDYYDLFRILLLDNNVFIKPNDSEIIKINLETYFMETIFLSTTQRVTKLINNKQALAFNKQTKRIEFINFLSGKTLYKLDRNLVQIYCDENIFLFHSIVRENKGIKFNGDLIRVDIGSGKWLWKTSIKINEDRNSLGFKFIKIIGYEIIIYLSNTYTFWGIDKNTGNINWKWDKKLSSSIVEEKKGQFINIWGKQLRKIDFTTRQVIEYDISEEMKKQKLTPFSRFTYYEGHIYFTDLKKGKVAVFNVKDKKVIWQYDLIPEMDKAGKRAYLNQAPIVIRNRIYLYDGAFRLWIFEKDSI